MLTPEQAKQALAAARLYDSEAAQRTASATLPPALRPIAYGLIGRSVAGEAIKLDHQQRTALFHRSFTQLASLSGAERLEVFAAFFPKIATEVELAWQALASLPYQARSASLPFRAPTRPEISGERRQLWFTSLLRSLGDYPQDIAWLAHHAAYLGSGYLGEVLGVLFAAVIDGDPVNGDAVFAILCDSACGEDAIGTLGQHIPVALLTAARPTGWEFIGKLLLAAQRQEGLRQVILGGLDAAHLGALRHILQLIVEHDLARFSAVTLALNGWLGTTWDSAQKTVINRTLSRLLTLFSDPPAREAALATGSGEAVYLALWTSATIDVMVALEQASALVADLDVQRRFAAVHLLATTALPEAAPTLLRALPDADRRVVARACQGLDTLAGDRRLDHALPIFEGVAAILPRFPKDVAAGAPLLFDAPLAAIDRERVAHLLLRTLGQRDPRQLLAYLPYFDQYGRVNVATQIAETDITDPTIRAALFALLRDRAPWVGERVIALLAKHPIVPTEVPDLEALLSRKNTDLRRGIIRLLVLGADAVALTSADRLTATSNAQQRLAGLELLRVLHEGGRSVAACADRAAAYRAAHAPLSPSEMALLDPIREAAPAKPTLANALGLVDSADRATIPAPVAHPVALHPARALANLRSLDDLIHAHREATYCNDNWQGQQEVVLGADSWHFPTTNPHRPIAEDAARLPLAELWRAWAAELPAEQRDADGLHFVRMRIALDLLGETNVSHSDAWAAMFGAGASEPQNLRYPRIITALCAWLVRLYPAPATADFLLDYAETILVELPMDAPQSAEDDRRSLWSNHEPMTVAIHNARAASIDSDARWSDAQWGRLWQLARWTTDLPREIHRNAPMLRETLAAERAGVATRADIILQLLGPRPVQRYGRGSFDDLRALSARKPHPLFAEYPLIAEIYGECERRILEVELGRGELPTEATPAALTLRSIAGAAWLIRIVVALDAERMKRGHSYHDESKATTLSHLLRATFPTAVDTPATFVAQVVAASLSEAQLVDAAVYAPQWAHLIEHALGWPAFTDAVWWLHAHTRDRNWSVEEDLRKGWEAQISERTPITSADLFDGAVDVAWFARVYAALGAARWAALDAAAKYASGGIGHARARLFADAMLGHLVEDEVIKRIQAKRHQDSVCALGLLPFPTADAAPALLRRYGVLQEFLRTSRAFGPQRRLSEAKVVRIAMDNLARTAGYPDPLRLQWAMELAEVADLRAGPISVTHDAVTLTLHIDSLGVPHLDVTKNGKTLKTLPPRLKQTADVTQLRERKVQLDQQVSRMRLALEGMMCREETFTVAELARLLGHPILAPLLAGVVFVGDGVMGYLVAGGQELRRHDGLVVPLTPAMALRIAHPSDLYHAGDWRAWQHECFVAERIQPFKQIFRELYVLTAAEQADGTVSHRYAGQQMQPRQAQALLGTRGWLGSNDDGSSRTFHERGLTASLTNRYGGYTAVDVEGQTIDGVVFSRVGDGHVLPLAEVPPIVFSEAMRDVDLAVSVAHRGGVDPETSASTVEMRTALIAETMALLGLANVRLDKRHAFITGELGEYALHLGSGIVHLMPGGALCIIPVHAQHRGRLFLPFADDDPKTAEIIAKVVLLAHDRGITDPLILQQIYARA